MAQLLLFLFVFAFAFFLHHGHLHFLLGFLFDLHFHLHFNFPVVSVLFSISSFVCLFFLPAFAFKSAFHVLPHFQSRLRFWFYLHFGPPKPGKSAVGTRLTNLVSYLVCIRVVSFGDGRVIAFTQ